MDELSIELEKNTNALLGIDDIKGSIESSYAAE